MWKFKVHLAGKPFVFVKKHYKKVRPLFRPFFDELGKNSAPQNTYFRIPFCRFAAQKCRYLGNTGRGEKEKIYSSISLTTVWATMSGHLEQNQRH
jgi:hypothetical protein